MTFASQKTLYHDEISVGYNVLLSPFIPTNKYYREKDQDS
jgi:hypothetical protein